MLITITLSLQYNDNALPSGEYIYVQEVECSLGSQEFNGFRSAEQMYGSTGLILILFFCYNGKIVIIYNINKEQGHVVPDGGVHLCHSI